MIIQLNTIPENVSFSNFGELSNNRFFHDHFISITNINQPFISGDLNGEDESYILYFKLSKITQTDTIRIRGLNCIFKDIRPNFKILTNWEVEINVKNNIDKEIFILFDCKKDYKTWKLQFGEGVPENPSLNSVQEWTYCRASFDYISVIRVSKPIDDNTMELPRFIINPTYSREQIGNPQRGDVGQPFGRNIRQLKTLSVNYNRVKTFLIDEYIERVGLAIPHFIVPYPENVFNVPPFWGTLQNMPVNVKRAENNWYWDLSLEWKEAY
jgi:hypothetical protein